MWCSASPINSRGSQSLGDKRELGKYLWLICCFWDDFEAQSAREQILLVTSFLVLSLDQRPSKRPAGPHAAQTSSNHPRPHANLGPLSCSSPSEFINLGVTHWAVSAGTSELWLVHREPTRPLVSSEKGSGDIERGSGTLLGFGGLWVVISALTVSLQNENV